MQWMSMLRKKLSRIRACDKIRYLRIAENDVNDDEQ